MKRLFKASVYLGALFLFGCDDEVTNRSDVPLSRAAAGKALDIPLPPSARDIYYLEHAGGMQDLERYIRFDLDPSELTAAVDALISANNKMMGRILPYPITSSASADLPTPRPEFLPMPWWTPSSVTKGYYRGHSDAHALRILVDEGSSRIYIHQND